MTRAVATIIAPSEDAAASAGFVGMKRTKKNVHSRAGIAIGEEDAPTGRRDAMTGFQEGPPPLTLGQVLDWAEHHQFAGQWPRTNSGPVPGQPGEDWEHIDRALRYGRRGLPGGTSLARLLA